MLKYSKMILTMIAFKINLIYISAKLIKSYNETKTI